MLVMLIRAYCLAWSRQRNHNNHVSRNLQQANLKDESETGISLLFIFYI